MAPPEDTSIDTKEAVFLIIEMWKHIASMQRILRNERPKGYLPTKLDARPKGRGLMPRHEWLQDFSEAA